RREKAWKAARTPPPPFGTLPSPCRRPPTRGGRRLRQSPRRAWQGAKTPPVPARLSSKGGGLAPTGRDRARPRQDRAPTGFSTGRWQAAQAPKKAPPWAQPVFPVLIRFLLLCSFLSPRFAPLRPLRLDPPAREA